MKKYIMITVFSLLILSAKGQQFGKETWTKITHEVKQLTPINKYILCELENLIFCTKQEAILDDFGDYKYFHLYVIEEDGRQLLEFRLSNYPYKSKNLLGFFIWREYLVFVHNELPDFLRQTELKKTFSYTEWKIGDVLMMEDDTPCWIIEYRNPKFIVLHYPTKK